MAVSDTRPFFLNLLKIRLPVQGMVSILHRISGVLMFLAIPFGAYLLDLSLQGDEGFHRASEILSQPLSQLVILLLIWSLVHHLFAGIRFLLIDFDIGLDKVQSRKTAWLVFAAEVIAILLLFLGFY